MRLVITQSTARTAALSKRLTERGHDVFVLPFSAIADTPGAPSHAALRQAMRDSDVVIPVSPTAVERMLSAWSAPADLPTPSWPTALTVAVVGPGSLKALAERLPTTMLARVVRPANPPYDARQLIAEPALQACAGRRVLVLRGEAGNDEWIAALRERGAIVNVLALYRNVAESPDQRMLGAWRDWLAVAPTTTPVWWFSQQQNARRGCTWLRLTGQSALNDRHLAWAIHPRIAQALLDEGWRHVSLVEPGESGLLAAIESSG